VLEIIFSSFLCNAGGRERGDILLLVVVIETVYLSSFHLNKHEEWRENLADLVKVTERKGTGP
jgi:hypothetical protein